MAPSDSTVVTGPTTAARLPRTGDVLGERWEIRASISNDSLYATYRGVDQETEGNVLVRVIGLGRLGERDAQRMAARLRLLIGMGGPTISAIRDVDQEGSRLFVIERFPDGASFRSVMDTRRAKGQLFTPAELLPLVAHLHGALAAITAPWFHGDVRAERVYVGPDRVLLTGGFALAVMSGELLRETLEGDALLRRELAPEVAEGLATSSSDRWGVASMVWEALTGALPHDPSGKRAALGALEPELTRYLSPDPSLRPASLEGLVRALATAARVPMPRVPVESFSPGEPPTDIDTTELAHAPVVIHGIDTERPEVGPSDTAKLPALDETGQVAVPTRKSDRPKRDLSDIDPALLAAAQASRSLSDSGTFELDAGELKPLETKPNADGARREVSTDLDPRLVRAALGVALEDSGLSAAPTLPTLEAKEPQRIQSRLPAPGRPMPAAKLVTKPKPANTTQEIDASELEVVGSPGGKVKVSLAQPRPTSLDSAETFVGERAVATSPAPLPSRPPAAAAAPAPALAPTPAPALAPAPAPQAAPAPAPLPRPAPHPRALAETPLAQPLAQREKAPVAPERSPVSGALIIGIALLLAAAILGGALWYRRSQEDSLRENRIEERLRELRTP